MASESSGSPGKGEWQNDAYACVRLMPEKQQGREGRLKPRVISVSSEAIAMLLMAFFVRFISLYVRLQCGRFL
jgi:hypothetical protein